MTHEKSLPELEFEKYTLANGLDVILREDRRLPLVAVNIWYHVGPANERPGLTGFAHLFEHMMFEGSRHVGEEGHFRHLESAGATEINGTTDFDRTNYFETLPSNQLELALWLESDRMGFLLETLDARKLETQRDVVRNERRQSIENVPYGLVHEELFHQLFPREHPYHASVIGSHADIEAARLADVREFFRLFYAPNNASLAIVGDIDPTLTRRLVEKYFGPIPAGGSVPGVRVRTPAIAAERRAVVGDKVELPQVLMAWITPAAYQPGDADLDLVGKILGGGKSSRLYRSLVYEKRIAQSASACQYSLALGSIFNIEATAKPGVQARDIETAIDEVLEQFLEEGPTGEELEGARNTMESAIIRGLETLGGMGGVADRLNRYNHFLKDPGYLPKDLARYRRVTPESMLSVARRDLARAARVVVHGVPGEKVIADPPRSEPEAETTPEEPAREIPAQDWRRTPPPPGAASTMELPVPKAIKLANGLTIYHVAQHDLPIVSANLIVLCGSERNPADLPGLASFTADMLDEGTSSRSALQIAVDADRLGATLSTGSSADLSYIAVRALRWNFEGALELLADVLLNPAFPEKEIERLRHDRQTRILQHNDNPASVASKVFCRVLFGDRHPYGHAEIGTRESIAAITREELAGFWSRGYVPQNAALVISGDIGEDELIRLAERLLGGWRRAGDRALPPGEAPHVSPRIVVVDKPGSPQTILRLGHAGVPRSSPDYVPLDVMNTALGGLFSSRINMNLREKNGYTYGASSAFAFRRGPGPFYVATGVRSDATGPAVREIVNEIERMRTSPPDDDELARARDSIARSLPGLFETTPQSASSIGLLFVHDLPERYYGTLPDAIARVTREEARRVARTYLKPGELVVVAVGDRSRIEPQLRELNLGPIELRDADGNILADVPR